MNHSRFCNPVHWMTRPPAVEPATVADAEPLAGAVEGEAGFLLSSLLVSSRIFLEAVTGRVFVDQGWAVVWAPRGTQDVLFLPPPLAPFRSLDRVTVCGAAGKSGSDKIDVSDVTVDIRGDMAALTCRGAGSAWIEPCRLRLDLTCGHGGVPDDIPESLREAVLRLALHWFEHREPIGFGRGKLELPPSVADLIAPYRVTNRAMCAAA